MSLFKGGNFRGYCLLQKDHHTTRTFRLNRISITFDDLKSMQTELNIKIRKLKFYDWRYDQMKNSTISMKSSIKLWIERNQAT